MKKVLSLITASCFALLIACGPSAEEKQAAEKNRLDSINQVMEQMKADSISKAMMEQARVDSMAMVMRADSIAKAEAAKKPAKKPKTTQQKKQEEAKKVTQGRGH